LNREFKKHKHKERDKYISPRTLKFSFSDKSIPIGFCRISPVE